MATVTHAFVSAIPDDPAALAAGEVCTQSHWNAAHVVTGVRTVLTANTNYYVTATGSDANDGSLAHRRDLNRIYAGQHSNLALRPMGIWEEEDLEAEKEKKLLNDWYEHHLRAMILRRKKK